MSDTTERLSIADAEALLTRVFVRSSVSEGNARSVARALVAAEVDGQSGHGFARVGAYAAQARSGKVRGDAVPVVSRPAPGVVRVDAGNGFAFPAIDAAVAHLVPAAREAGIAVATIFRSHHCGQLGAHVERLAEQGVVALMTANTPKAMAPWGGTAGVFGTNPIAFAAPRERHPPLAIDLSLSEVARGKVMAARKRGEPIPQGWALDASGAPTTDPEAALAGTMAPAGGAKGAALALMVEILSAALTGARFSYEASSFFEAEGEPPGVGQTLIAIDPLATAAGSFGARLEELVSTMLAEEGVRLPGARRFAGRVRCRDEGIAVPAHLMTEIRSALA